MTKDAFYKATYAGFGSGKGKTIRQIGTLLGEFHEIKKDGKHITPGAPQDRAINILHEIREDINFWMSTHEGDTSRSKKRIPGLTNLFVEAGKELAELTRLRDDARKFFGMAQEPIERTENKYITKAEGSVSKVLETIGEIVASAAPNEGDSAEIEVAIKIPCDPSATTFLGGRLKVAVSRGKKEKTKLRMESALTGGVKLGSGTELSAELGGYIEAEGATPRQAMELLSYGMYRRIRESKVIPNEVANVLWGGSATEVGWNRSEKWAARIEKENFKSSSDSGYVETGGMVGAKAKAGLGNAKIEGGISYRGGKKYNFDSVSKMKKSGLGVAAQAPVIRGQTNVIGDSVHYLDVSGTASGGPLSGGIKVSFGWASSGGGKTRLSSLGIGLTASGTLPMHQLIGGGIYGAVPPIVANLTTLIRLGKDALEGEEKSKGQAVGTGLSAITNAGTSLAQLAELPQQAWVPSFGPSGTPPAFEAPVEVKLSISGSYDPIKDVTKFEVKLEYIKGINLNLGVFTGKVRQGQKLLRFYYDGTKWGVD